VYVFFFFLSTLFFFYYTIYLTNALQFLVIAVRHALVLAYLSSSLLHISAFPAIYLTWRYIVAS